MWVTDHLKAPDEGSWIAFTRVDADGRVERLGYASSIGGIPAARIKELRIDGYVTHLRLAPDAEFVDVKVVGIG
jgi:hypothetical protein